MAVKVISRKYKNNFRPEEIDWLLGNVGDWMRLTLELEVSTVYYATDQEPIEVDYLNDAFVLVNGQNWGSYGFDIGMTANVYFRVEEDTNGDGNFDSNGILNSSFTITNIFDNVMEIDQDLQNLGGYTRIPTNLGRKRVTEAMIFSLEQPQGCDITYGHITNDNSETTNLNSLIDGTTTKFIAPSISGAGNGTQMEAVGMQSGMSITNAFVKYLGSIREGEKELRYRYEINIDFLISTFFEDITNLEELELPSYLTGDGSLTDNFIINFYPEWNNPNLIIKNDLSQTVRLGNTGWFNENFNELNNDFEVLDLDYFDENGAPVDSLDYASTTKVVARISSLQEFSDESRFTIGFGWIPNNPEDYKNKEENFLNNTYVSTVAPNFAIHLGEFILITTQGFGIDGANMGIGQIQFTGSGNEVLMQCNFRPNAQFFQQFDLKEDDDRNYYIWVAVDDRDLDTNFSQRVTLLLDVNQLKKTIPFGGVYENIQTQFLEHHEETEEQGVPNYNGIVQDDLLARSSFRIPKDGTIRFQSMEFGFESYNMSTLQSYELENVPVDLTAFPVFQGVGQFDYDETRGFKLNIGNNKNFVKVLRNEEADTDTEAGYIALFGSKLRWEQWLQRQDAPVEFFNPTEEHNGFHNDWINYQRTVGFKFFYYVTINAVVDRELTRFKNRFEISFNDYDENQNIQTQSLYYRHSDDTLLNVGQDAETGAPLGVILNNEETRIEISFTRLDNDIWENGKFYAVTTIEVDRGAGEFEQRQLSTVWESESDNPLKPLQGEEKLSYVISEDQKTVTTFCLVDPELLEDAQQYRVTGRIGGCSLIGDDNGNEPLGLYEDKYEDKYE